MLVQGSELLWDGERCDHALLTKENERFNLDEIHPLSAANNIYRSRSGVLECPVAGLTGYDDSISAEFVKKGF